MPKIIDLTGQNFDRIAVIRFSHRDRYTHWICRCSCGVEKTIRGGDLKTGHVRSCGCLSLEVPHHVTHGLVNHPLYSVWGGMKTRCYNKKENGYKNYGGRGIIVCDKWNKDFVAFYDWAIVNGYQNGLTIERINNDGNYEPNNCKFILGREQGRNQRRTKLNSVKVMTIKNLSRIGAFTIQELSGIYNVSTTHIRRVINNKTWV